MQGVALLGVGQMSDGLKASESEFFSKAALVNLAPAVSHRRSPC